jgi:hypothetical protein
MIEHCSEFVPDVDVLRCVTLPAVPNVYGLEEPDQRVAHWVFALPGGQAYIVSSDEEGSGALGAHRPGARHGMVGTLPWCRAGAGHLPSGEFRHHLIHDWLHTLLADGQICRGCGYAFLRDV